MSAIDEHGATAGCGWMFAGLLLLTTSATGLRGGEADDGERQALLPATETAVAEHAFVLVELFTSEGCSSCPRADAFVNHLAEEARAKGLPVATVAWHVTYWNKLRTKHGAWRDPYSLDASTRRQKRYAATIESPYKGRLVTPQILIDGRHLQRDRDRPITEFFADRLGVAREVAVGVAPTADGIAFEVAGAPEGCELLAVLVQRGIEQEVDKGENHGRTLHHEHVARALSRTRLEPGDSDGELELAVPDGVDPADCAIVAIVQHREDLAVHAVTMRDLIEPEARRDPAIPGLDAPAEGGADCAAGVCVAPQDPEAEKAACPPCPACAPAE